MVYLPRVKVPAEFLVGLREKVGRDFCHQPSYSVMSVVWIGFSTIRLRSSVGLRSGPRTYVIAKDGKQ